MTVFAALAIPTITLMIAATVRKCRKKVAVKKNFDGIDVYVWT